jgi:hypothetical protein
VEPGAGASGGDQLFVASLLDDPHGVEDDQVGVAKPLWERVSP